MAGEGGSAQEQKGGEDCKELPFQMLHRGGNTAVGQHRACRDIAARDFLLNDVKQEAMFGHIRNAFCSRNRLKQGLQMMFHLEGKSYHATHVPDRLTKLHCWRIISG